MDRKSSFGKQLREALWMGLGLSIWLFIVEPRLKKKPETWEPSRPHAEQTATVPERNTQKVTTGTNAPDSAAQSLRALQPQLPKLAEAVEAYTLALESTISGAELVVSQVTAFANSPEIRKAFATDPSATQRTVNNVCSKCYEAFNKQARKNWNILQDALVSDKIAKASVKVGLQPESNTKEVLSRILDNCEKARRKLNRISTVSELEVADQMKQVNEARADLAPLAKEMRAELELLRAMIQSANKS